MSSLWGDSSSCYPDEPELELGLGLSIGGGGKSKAQQTLAASGVGSWDQYARILTSNDFRSSSPIKATSSSSSCSGSRGTKVHINGYSGTKRAAEEPSSPPGRSAIGQLVGWPPVRTYRINNLSNHGKSLAAEESSSNVLDRYKSQNVMVKKTDLSCNDTRSFFVKVYMDGIPIGRKVDLNAHSCYQTLARTLDHMFTVSAEAGTRRRALRLSDAISDFVLTYEDKEGDWMLVGDVPWEVFISSVKRLRIRRAAEANGPPI